jgi:hypothetical protein
LGDLKVGQTAIMRSGILNIRTHPHDEETYNELMQSFFDLRRATKIRGDRYGVISLLERNPDDDGMLRGVLTTFTKIDENSDWFDLENMKEATGDKVSEISIPKNLYPNPRAFYFYFSLRKHRLYLQTYSKGDRLSIRDAERFFQSIAGSKKIRKKFGDVKINMVQSHQSLAKIFNMKKITKIRVIIEKPNSDIFDENFEANIEQHLEETNSRQVEIAYSSERGQSIAVTDDIRKIGGSALDNGHVEVIGQSAIGREKRSSRSHPKIVQEEYDTGLQTEAQALRSLAARQ